MRANAILVPMAVQCVCRSFLWGTGGERKEREGREEASTLSFKKAGKQTHTAERGHRVLCEVMLAFTNIIHRQRMV